MSALFCAFFRLPLSEPVTRQRSNGGQGMPLVSIRYSRRKKRYGYDIDCADQRRDLRRFGAEAPAVGHRVAQIKRIRVGRLPYIQALHQNDLPVRCGANRHGIGGAVCRKPTAGGKLDPRYCHHYLYVCADNVQDADFLPARGQCFSASKNQNGTDKGIMLIP